jgi:transcriptional regulator
MAQDDRLQLLPGTLEMLVLQSLVFGPRHGHGIATTIQRTSKDLLLVDHGSLYPALQRLERAGLIASEWGTSDNHRRARFYRLTHAGRKKLAHETGKWRRLCGLFRAFSKHAPGRRKHEMVWPAGW